MMTINFLNLEGNHCGSAGARENERDEDVQRQKKEKQEAGFLLVATIQFLNE